ncbi:MAG: PQQ-like beta-propeller repeat protein [Fuerstiella sp.]|nr:PQQ-like beta-propeller repeat protein [Fuerstiella sp.]
MLHRYLAFICCLLVAATITTADDANSIRLQNWAEWRGPLRTGVAPFADPPVEWNEKKNVRWKVKMPGLGHSSPVVWQDSVFLTTAIPYGPQLDPVPVTAAGAHDNVDVTRKHRFVVIRVSRKDGAIRWQTVVNDVLPHEGGHDTGSLASASPVTDGQRVYAYFGSHGLFALDFNGRLLWKRDPGRMQSKHAHGEGSSPSLHNGTLVINADHEGQSFIEAVDAATGVTKWKRNRDEVTSWASPLIVEHDNRAQVVVAGTDRVRAYDLETGNVLWKCGGLSANVVATPVAADGILIAASSYDTRAMLAINMNGATGDITGSQHLLWSTTQRTPYVPSMLLVEQQIYCLRHYQNILSRRHIRTGAESAGPFRLSGIQDIYASPVAAAGRIYITDLNGRTLVFTHDDQPEYLALNPLDDSFAATPALVGTDLFLRGRQFLYCIADRDISNVSHKND